MSNDLYVYQLIYYMLEKEVLVPMLLKYERPGFKLTQLDMFYHIRDFTLVTKELASLYKYRHEAYEKDAPPQMLFPPCIRNKHDNTFSFGDEPV